MGLQGHHTSSDVKALTKLKIVQFKLTYYKSIHGNSMQTLIHFNIGLRRYLLPFVQCVKSASDEIKGIWLINHPDRSLITIKVHHHHLIQNKRQYKSNCYMPLACLPSGEGNIHYWMRKLMNSWRERACIMNEESPAWWIRIRSTWKCPARGCKDFWKCATGWWGNGWHPVSLSMWSF